MGKFTKLFIFVCLILNLQLYAESGYRNPAFGSAPSYNRYDVEKRVKNGSVGNYTLWNSVADDMSAMLATPPPTVTTPIYYCQNKAASPLTATPSAGGTLIWYGTSSTLGTGSSTAPTPSTSTVGTTSYYVSQTVGGVESSRSKIDVNVIADNGATILNLRCDPTQATAANTVFFDWSNNPLISNTYNYTYTISGGSPVSGSTGVSHHEVFNLMPGQSVTLTLSSATHPCVPPQTITCSAPCGSTKVTPTFTFPTSYCLNEAAPALPSASADSPAITGTWSPAAINTTTTGTTNYTFTPDPVMHPCALTRTIAIKVGPVEPNFVDIEICSGQLAPSLATTSPNGISGSWNPAIIDNNNSGSYLFTPNPGQPCVPTTKTINVTVYPSNAITDLDYTVTAAFVENQVVTVTNPVGVQYYYQLDFGPFQESPVFENVALGSHSLTVKDAKGCSIFTNNNVLVINYPRYFTPNDDGSHDRWNIFTLENQSDFRILIFDRYGKFLKEIRPGSDGWDGNYNGQPMPANDYWFSVEYAEDNVSKIFKSHFSLKR